jgi:fructosamine-3-kinase
MFNQEQKIIQLCVHRLAEQLGQPVHLNHIRAAGGGCINHASKLETSAGDFFLKWNTSAPSDLFLKEAAALQEMYDCENPYLAIPRVIWCKAADDSPGLLLTEYLQPPESTSGFEEKLGRGIAVLHRKTAAAYGFHEANYCGTTVQDNTRTSDWSEFYGQRRIWALVQQIRLARALSESDLQTYEKLVARIPQLLSHQTVPSLIHGDLWSGNYLFTTRGPALIDPACYYADREMELGMMQLFGGFSSRVWSAYQEAFPLPGDWRSRIRLYQLYHVLNHFLLFGGSYNRQALDLAKSYL